MSLASNAYRFLFRRSSALAVSVIVGVVVFERAFDQGGDALFEYLNEGMLWKDIKHRYEKPPEAGKS